MITIRHGKDRGHFNHGWLDTFHTFSFADYWDPRHMGFRALRVINEDRVEPGMGFPTHPHRDMEILTWVVGGSLQHRDSMGNGSIIRPGEIQRMTAGTGVRHSEFNPSGEEALHLLQIWIHPERPGLEPGYEQKAFDLDANPDQWVALATSDARNGSVLIHQDVSVEGIRLTGSAKVERPLLENRHAWVHVVRGKAIVAGNPLEAGDAAAISGETQLLVQGAGPAELLLFDLG